MTELCARTRSCIEDDYEDDQAGRHIGSPNLKMLRGKALQSVVVYIFLCIFTQSPKPEPYLQVEHDSDHHEGRGHDAVTPPQHHPPPCALDQEPLRTNTDFHNPTAADITEAYQH